MRKKVAPLISALFFIVLVLNIIAVATKNDFLEMVFKPLLMTVLAVFYLVSVKQPNFWYLSALFFSFWGDVLLLFKDKYFVFGLSSFLVAHLLYIKLTANFFKRTSVLSYLKAFIPFVLLFIPILFLIKDNLKEMFVPVLVYGLVISAFGMVTLVNCQQKKNNVSLLLLVGAFIFIVSDGFIAINRFYDAKLIYSVLIIGLYSLAQYLICRAVIIEQKVIGS